MTTCVQCGGPKRSQRGSRCQRCAGNAIAPDRVCAGCGATFRKSHGGRRKGIYCTRECAWADIRRRGERKREAAKQERHALTLRSCTICAQQFTAPRYRERQHLCSEACRAEHARRYILARDRGRKALRSRACRECGRVFVPVYGNKRRHYCSQFCLSRKMKRIAKRTRRARLAGVHAENVDPVLVFRRDRWRCQLCGTRTPSRLRGCVHDQAPELDHIVPLALGGGHTYANTQCACRRCNHVKGAKPLVQLRLA